MADKCIHTHSTNWTKFKRIMLQSFLSQPPMAEIMLTADCWVQPFLESDGHAFYSLLSHTAPSHHPCSHHSKGSLSTFTIPPLISGPFGCDLLPKEFTANCSFLSFFFISSSSVFPSHADLYYGISLGFVCFPLIPFISQSVWPHIIFKVDPNAFPGTCQHALPVSLRHKSNIWKKTNKYKCK